MQAKREDIISSLNALRATQGDEAYNQARDTLAVMLINQPRGADFLQDAFPDLDLNRVRELARITAQKQQAAVPPNDMLALIRTHVPHLQTEGQLDCFMLAFNAFTLAFDSYLAGNVEAANKARATMNRALDLAEGVGEMQAKVSELPPEARSADAARYVEPPKLFTEADEKARLMVELDALTTKSGLNEWYQNERKRIDGVVSKTLRDELFDAIRAKQQSLLN